MGKAEITTIPYIRKVYYDTYANLPVAGIKIGDLGYATDHRCLYRWSGAAWDVITIYSHFGLIADIPALPSLPNGSLYHATDTDVLYMVQSGVWEALPKGAQLTVAETEVFSASAPTTWTDLDINAVVGSNVSLVILKIYPSTDTEHVAFRKNGDTDEFYAAITGYNKGAAAIYSSSIHLVVVVATDASGIIEWKASTARTMTIDVIAFVK